MSETITPEEYANYQIQTEKEQYALPNAEEAWKQAETDTGAATENKDDQGNHLATEIVDLQDMLGKSEEDRRKQEDSEQYGQLPDEPDWDEPKAKVPDWLQQN